MRTDDEERQLLTRIFDEITAEPAMAGPFRGEIAFAAGQDRSRGSIQATIEEPRRQDLRSLLVDVRKLDAPGEDVFPSILDILQGQVEDPVFRQALADARAHYDGSRGADPNTSIVDPDGNPSITPREAFELWVYGSHLHNDQDKEERWQSFGISRPIVRHLAVGYMHTLLNIASYCRAVIEHDVAFRHIATPTRSAG